MGGRLLARPFVAARADLPGAEKPALGAVIIVAGIATPLLGVERARLIIDWWAAHGTGFLRAWAGVAVELGLFLAYAVAPRTPCVHRR